MAKYPNPFSQQQNIISDFEYKYVYTNNMYIFILQGNTKQPRPNKCPFLFRFYWSKKQWFFSLRGWCLLHLYQNGMIRYYLSVQVQTTYLHIASIEDIHNTKHKREKLYPTSHVTLVWCLQCPLVLICILTLGLFFDELLPTSNQLCTKSLRDIGPYNQ